MTGTSGERMPSGAAGTGRVPPVGPQAPSILRRSSASSPSTGTRT